MSDTIFEGWAIMELMGHRRLAGYVAEQEIAGHGFLRVDVYRGDDPEPVAAQFYSPAAVYAMTPTTEALARRMGKNLQPAPVSRWELPEAGTLTIDDREDGWGEEPEGEEAPL